MYITPPSSPRGGTPVARGPLSLNSLKNLLNRSGKNWAFTGSQAMKLHETNNHPMHRRPNDIDILVNQLNLGNFITLLKSIGYKLNGPPPMRGNNKATLKNGNQHIDLLVAGKLGPKFTPTTVTKVKGFPVVTIPHLISLKRAAGGNSAAENVAFLKRLLRSVPRHIE